MKKLLLAALLTSSVISTNTHATVGLFVSAPVAIAGLVVTLVGSGMVGATQYEPTVRKMDLITGLMFAFAGPFVVLTGLILLDEQTQSLRLAELTPEMAEKLKISNNEMDQYNSELEIIQTIMSEAQSTTKNLDEKEALVKSKQIWAEGLEAVSMDTKSALTKIFSAQQ